MLHMQTFQKWLIGIRSASENLNMQVKLSYTELWYRLKALLLTRVELTLVWPWDEPQAAVVDGGILQGDPQPHDSAQGLRVQKWGILMWRH